MSKLTTKQRKFCDEYIRSGNASKAYVEAGYSMKSNKAIASEAWKLLRKPNIAAYIQAKMDEIESSKIASAKEILKYLTSVMRGEQTETVATSKGIFEGVEVSAKDRISAAKELLKRYPVDPVGQAQLRKIVADARISEAKAKTLEDNGQDMENLLDRMLDTIQKEDQKDDTK